MYQVNVYYCKEYVRSMHDWQVCLNKHYYLFMLWLHNLSWGDNRGENMWSYGSTSEVKGFNADWSGVSCSRCSILSRESEDKLMPWSSTAVSCSGVIMSSVDSCIYGKEAGWNLMSYTSKLPWDVWMLFLRASWLQLLLHASRKLKKPYMYVHSDN